MNVHLNTLYLLLFYIYNLIRNNEWTHTHTSMRTHCMLKKSYISFVHFDNIYMYHLKPLFLPFIKIKIIIKVHVFFYVTQAFWLHTINTFSTMIMYKNIQLCIHWKTATESINMITVLVLNESTNGCCKNGKRQLLLLS